MESQLVLVPQTREEWIAFKALYFNNGAGEINQETLNQLVEFTESTP